jgi:hypothetical protein
MRRADQWEVVEFPAIFPETNNPLWPEFWNLEELEKVKASLTVSAWSAQWMQNPSAEESAILKREYWRIWEKKKPPECNYILQSYDTAFSKKARLTTVPAPLGVYLLTKMKVRASYCWTLGRSVWTSLS